MSEIDNVTHFLELEGVGLDAAFSPLSRLDWPSTSSFIMLELGCELSEFNIPVFNSLFSDST